MGFQLNKVQKQVKETIVFRDEYFRIETLKRNKNVITVKVRIMVTLRGESGLWVERDSAGALRCWQRPYLHGGIGHSCSLYVNSMSCTFVLCLFFMHVVITMKKLIKQEQQKYWCPGPTPDQTNRISEWREWHLHFLKHSLGVLKHSRELWEALVQWEKAAQALQSVSWNLNATSISPYLCDSEHFSVPRFPLL